MSTGLYDDAEVFDILHAPGTRAEVDGLERIAQKYCASASAQRPLTWLEPACGTGRYLVEAARRGHVVIGFDRSRIMIAYAKARLAMLRGRAVTEGRRVHRLFVADMTRFASRSLPPVDFAFCMINTVRHLDSDAAMIRHLREVAKVLAPGGVYAVGLGTTGYGIEGPNEDVWQGRRGSVRVKQIAAYIPPRTSRERFEQVYSHLVISRGRREEHRDDSYRLRCYDDAQWRRVVKRAGLRIVAVTDDEGQPHDPGPFGYAVYVLTRSGPSGSRVKASMRPARRPRRASP